MKFISGNIATSDFKITDKYDAILAARILHFLSPKELKIAVSNLNSLLKVGGKVYIVAITPYVKRYESFIPEYKKRVAKGEEFPGYVKSLEKFINKKVTTTPQISSISESFMFLDDTVLKRLFENQKFKILECKMVSLGYKSSSWSLDGRENIILIAEKL